MIEVDGLRKKYGDFVAVEGSSFSVEAGEVFGLVGPNGAGKTTTLKALVGLLEPTAGTARVAGRPPAEPATRADLGWLPEESPLYEDMTARSYLRFFADLYDVPRDVADTRINDTLDRLDLDRRDRPLGDCSKGMKRKVAIARSLVNDPDAVVYDEPASGLDPLTTHVVVEFTRELAEEGKAVLFSAHDLHHVESVCDRVAIMHEGQIVTRGSLGEIRAEHGGTSYHVYATVPVDGSEPAGDRHHATVDSMDAVEQRRTEAENQGGRVVDIRTEEPSLEEVFLSVTSEGAAGGVDA
jgi:ABC-2 type transport system ATP-binding protein